jgi:hypothetical protein
MIGKRRDRCGEGSLEHGLTLRGQTRGVRPH